MKLSKRFAKFLKLCIIVCVCGSILFGIVLINKADDFHDITNIERSKSFKRYDGNLHVQLNPRHILPAFVQRLRPVNSTVKTFLNQSQISKVNLSSYFRDDLKITPAKQRKNMLSNVNASKEILQLRETVEPPSYDVHAFYYPWYGTPELDGQYFHWSHPYIRHWNAKEAQKWPNYTHKPPDDIGSNFYPLLGAYSSRDTEIIDVHMQMMRYARIGVVVVSWYPPGDADKEGIVPDSLMPLMLNVAAKYQLKLQGVVVVSWYPPGDADNEGREPDSVMPLILEGAAKYDLKVAIHIEPYRGRNHVTLRKNLEYILEKYGKHPAFYRTSFKGKRNVPLIYIYDSYLVDSKDWATILTSNGRGSIRNTELDCIFIGLLVESAHKEHVLKSGFDGFYTYFATNRFTYGSTWKTWPHLAQLAQSKGLLFIPSVGPGYIDTEVRPWNGANTRKRLDGKYYNEAFASALSVKPSMVSITSFNEWHEGTQIEPAVSKKIKMRRYEDYGSKGPNFYLDLTKAWVDKIMHR